MMDTPNRLIVVIAAGPMIGVETAAIFASRGFTHVALVSRDIDRLAKDAEAKFPPVSDQAGRKPAVVKTFAADVSIPISLGKALSSIKAEFGAPEVVLYNASRIWLANLRDFSASDEDLVTDFKVTLSIHHQVYR
jgi:NAD(P)-dependent dehydrogenase (short-subunit alcohol dehydrogenase family)